MGLHPWGQSSHLGRANQRRRFGQSHKEVSRIGRLSQENCEYESLASSLGCVVTAWKEKDPGVESQVTLALQTSPRVQHLGQLQTRV